MGVLSWLYCGTTSTPQYPCEDVIQDQPRCHQGGCKPPDTVTGTLFSCVEDSPSLSVFDTDSFHSIMQKLIYICKRARLDIKPAISYLCKRVSDLKEEDDKKLTQVIGYLERTLDDERVLGATSLSTLCTWVETSYAVHST